MPGEGRKEDGSLLFRMLPQLSRLRKQADINKVFKKGKTLSRAPLSLKLTPNFLSQTRFCFIVPAKTAKKAVLRNKIRRRLSEIIRINLPKIKNGFDVLILTCPGTDKLTFLELKERAQGLFQKANLL